MNSRPLLERIKEAVKSATARGAEAAASLVLVLVFFLVFLGILSLLFPSGAGLKDLMRSNDLSSMAPEAVADPKGIVAVKKGPASGGPRGADAILTGTRNEVKSRKADSVAWEQARIGMRLRSRDAVQTFGQAGASIALDANNTLDVGENSLVIIRRLEQDPVVHAKRSFLLMVDGELRGNIQGKGRESIGMEIASAGGVGRIASGSGAGGPAEFQVTVNPDKSATYSVFRGTAEVEAQGRLVRVGPNAFTMVVPDQPPSSPEPLPPSPTLLSPAHGAVFPYRSLAPRISFSWVPSEGDDGYRFVLARDPDFRTILVNEKLSEAAFTHGNLKAGDYYWRVSGKKKGAVGAFSRAGHFRLAQTRVPPRLKAEKACDLDGGIRCVVKGSADPGATVYVAGSRVPTTAKGEFESAVGLKKGTNVIVVEAVDAAGNVAYQSVRVDGKP